METTDQRMQIDDGFFGTEIQHREYPCRYDLMKIARTCLDRYDSGIHENKVVLISQAIQALEDLKEIEQTQTGHRKAMNVYLFPLVRDGKKLKRVFFRDEG